MFGLILPILNALLGGIIKPFVAAWTDYQKSKEAGFAAGAAADASVMRDALMADVQMNALKVQLYGTPIYRLVTAIVGIPVALQFSLVFVDTILSSKFLYGHAVLGISPLPAPYDTYGWAIVSSFFIVHAVTVGTSNVSKWLGK